MRRTIRIATIAALASLCLGSTAGAKVVTFRISGAGVATPVSMNDKGQVTGTSGDLSGAHGFIWQPDGAFLAFDVPGADTTVPVAITPTGVVIGNYYVSHKNAGFIRAADGTITTFKAPHGHVIAPMGANRKGWCVGRYSRSFRLTSQPFLRDPSGRIQEFSVPGASGGAGAIAVNNSQTIAGIAQAQSDSKFQGFVRSPDGTVTMFGNPELETIVAGINDTGTIVGHYVDVDHQLQSEGFVRTNDGTITTFVAPNGASQTSAAAINNSGTIVGVYSDSGGISHGYLRTADGTLTPFDPEGSVFTEIGAINNKGAIAGDYMDKDGVQYVFAGKP